MKMTRMDIILIKTPKPHAGGDTWYVLRLRTDEGINGLGESMPHFAFHAMEKAYVDLAQSVFERWFKGQDPVKRDLLVKTAYDTFCAGHPDMLGLSILSGIEMAMWDIVGKVAGLPVYDLLGGGARDRLRSYAYISYEDMTGGGKNYSDIVGDPVAVAERATQMMEQGFTAVKIDPLEYRIPAGTQSLKPYPLEPLDFLKSEATLDALKIVTGNTCDILLGTHGQMTTASAIRYARFLEKYNPLFLEEPIPPGNFIEMAKVKHATCIPIAAGERIMTVFEAGEAMDKDAVSILQPDIGTCGGISQAKKMAAVCEAHFVNLSPHLWGGPVLTSAALQISMHVPNFLIQESILTMKGFYSDITTVFHRWENGYIYPSGAPGLGVELNDDLTEKFVVK
jgi:galactonate dehydratase